MMFSFLVGCAKVLPSRSGGRGCRRERVSVVRTGVREGCREFFPTSFCSRIVQGKILLWFCLRFACSQNGVCIFAIHCYSHFTPCSMLLCSTTFALCLSFKKGKSKQLFKIRLTRSFRIWRPVSQLPIFRSMLSLLCFRVTGQNTEDLKFEA